MSADRDLPRPPQSAGPTLFRPSALDDLETVLRPTSGDVLQTGLRADGEAGSASH